MSFSTLLDIVTQVADELALPRPSAVFASSDRQTQQMLAFINKSGRELLRAHQWSALLTLGTILTVAGTSDYTLPADFDRLVSSTEWDRTNHWRMMGPDTPQVARWRNESNLAQASVRRSLRLIGSSTLRVYPTPTSSNAGQTLVYEYASKNWARSAANAAQSAFAADTDTTVYDPELLSMALKYHFMHAKGFDASAYFAEYQNRLKTAIAADLGGPTLSTSEKLTEQFLNFQNVPEAGYGQ